MGEPRRGNILSEMGGQLWSAGFTSDVSPWGWITACGEEMPHFIVLCRGPSFLKYIHIAFLARALCGFSLYHHILCNFLLLFEQWSAIGAENRFNLKGNLTNSYKIKRRWR